MSIYRKEWPCCDSATETNAWEPEECPFCRATPSSECALPPLPPANYMAHVYGYTAEQVEQIRREAYEAGKNSADTVFRAVRAGSAEQYRKLEDERDALDAEVADLREAVEADRRARTITELLNNPPHGEPDLYSRLHTALTGELELAKARGKAAEWSQAAHSLIDYLTGAQLARQSQEPQGQAEPLPAARYEHAEGFADAKYVEFPAGSKWGYGVRFNGSHGPSHYSRQEADGYTLRRIWREVAAPAHPVAQPALRGSDAQEAAQKGGV